MAILTVNDIHAGYYAGIEILNGISLQVTPASITGIIGPNGAGKSTLLKVIFGFLSPWQGAISFEGAPIAGLSPAQIKRLGISYVPQGINIFPQMTVEENLLLGAWTFRGEKQRVRSALEQVYSLFPALAEHRHRRAVFLSGGQAKMLSIAKEVISAPRLLLVDEPSAGLAPRIAGQVYDFLLQSQAAGLSILLVDQNINKAVEISGYLYMIEMGRVKLEGERTLFADNLRQIVRDSLIGV
ncbi:MAG: ABC transporter ATP-binding protein [Nitrospinota bacterium]|nr:MAG: ABC transporter ATP-binding protein [Nitrospinota bacterium]